ncbi:MAG: hypothetical protein EOO73_30735 [Myxococcales bacterium]|nr:MAG: hypothetical protein EOO73_30735 [Myxococcales bacterium]
MRALAIALCFCLLGTMACERRRRIQSKLITASATGSGQVLDGMQFESARRVAREQGKEAMKARNPQRLRQLRTWVEDRASVPIFPAEDLAALDAAIACLEQTATPSEIAQQLAAAKTSKLAEAAGVACEPLPPE